MPQVQVRMTEKEVEEIDRLVADGHYRSRSDAIRGMAAFYLERQRTQEFLSLLEERSRNAREHPETLVELE